jgi:V/A-type H+-transporting ATPase subunit I
LNILLVSIGAGIVLLNIGFILNLIRTGMTGEWSDFLFGESGLAGWLLYLSLLGIGLGIIRDIPIPSSALTLVTLVSAVLILLHTPLGRLINGQRPLLETSWGEYSVLSFFEFFEALISYISNSLSFVRLGAFAVAHVGLSQIVLSMAGRGGGVTHWVILIIGTAIIIGFEGLIVGIQALRLEYYEFFGKFFQGGGIPFQPFRLPAAEEA